MSPSPMITAKHARLWERGHHEVGRYLKTYHTGICESGNNVECDMLADLTTPENDPWNTEGAVFNAGITAIAASGPFFDRATGHDAIERSDFFPGGHRVAQKRQQ